jgi:glycosyltransferase involved in cell wall biosynthesis
VYPSLCLTLADSYRGELRELIEKAKRENKLDIRNVPTVSQNEVRQLYSQTQALVYPSVMESFGLPLIEARRAGLPILASELDYVRDLVDPEEVFDPRSPMSIARAVKRFLQIPEAPSPSVSCDAFLARLLAVS